MAPEKKKVLTELDPEQLNLVCRDLKTLAVPARLKVLAQFESRTFQVSVGAIAERSGISPTLASLHLMRLTEEGLLDRPARGQFHLTEKGKWWLRVISARSSLS